ncbi:MAG: putative cobaltochelatase [Anaerolineae bacterium]|nr:putative cobaltochelatase [Anaerolineae bacterium]MDW8067482.1 putative cobaltochelatase [Anaerolineae bacterium]
MPPIFPFTAIVNQDLMRRALVLNAVYPQIGGVLIRGERGTGKSTAARALAALLPEIEVVADCPFSCDPDQPATWCTLCRERAAAGEELPRARRRTRFVDLPVSATEDRVVGTLDIEQAIQKGERRFEPGVLAAANRGVLYVDEVNLLDDHVVDILLDAAAMGINVVEREGISFTHPARFILIGTMNPEEGDLRPQLLDRFALCVDIRSVHDPGARMLIMERNLAFESDPEGFYEEWRPREEALSREIARARQLLPRVCHTRGDLALIAAMMAEMQVDGHRPDMVILKTARANAAFEGRDRINDRDILLAAELALPHRLRRHPLQPIEATLDNLGQRLEEARARMARQESRLMEEVIQEEDVLREEKKTHIEADLGESSSEERERPREPIVQAVPQWPSEGRWWEGGKNVPVGEPFSPRRLDTPLDRLTRSGTGRRSTTRTDQRRGRYIQARPSPDDPADLAFDATLRAAAPHQSHRRRPGGPALVVRPDDYHRKVRIRRMANLILFVVDASWSMAVAERMEATKGAVLSLLTDAYQRRDRVGVVVFQKNGARLVLPPTRSVARAHKALQDIPVGGKTPLSAGLHLAYQVITRELRQHPDLMPLMVLLTDGAGNVSMSDLPPQEEAHQIADLFPQAQIRSVVINMEHEAFDQGLAQALADHLQAPCYRLEELRADALLEQVRRELDL